MIRRAVYGDRSDIFNIWRICFGDSVSYIDFFLDRGFDADSCLLWVEDGIAVAMLHILNAKYISSAARDPVQYIYAAATLPAYRGRGIMPRLLQAAEKDGAAKGCIFTYLLPASSSLYEYYARQGYKTAFYIKKARVTRKKLEDIASENKPCTLFADINANADADDDANVDVDADAYKDIYKLRRVRFSPAVLWEKPELSYALAEWQFSDGDILHYGSYYAIFKEHNGIVEVRESSGSITETATALLNRYSCGEFVFFLPPDELAPFKTEILAYGMLKPTSLTSNILEKVIAAKPYVNLMLE